MEKQNSTILQRISGAVHWSSVFCDRASVVKRLLTIAEAAALLGVKPQTLYLWVSLRRIPCRKIGRLVRFTEADLEEFVNKQLQAPAGPDDDALSTR